MRCAHTLNIELHFAVKTGLADLIIVAGYQHAICEEWAYGVGQFAPLTEAQPYDTNKAGIKDPS
jgi:3-oxoacyl-(acyl-carrier-protein) synthase